MKEWLTLPSVAIMLKVTRSRVHQMVNEGKFADVARLGTKILVIHKSSVDKVLAIQGAR